MSKGKKTDAKPSPDEAVRKAVEDTPGGTTEGIAQVAGIARSTAGKVLARLADANEVTRHQGGRDKGKRLPDRWTLAGVEMPPAYAGHVTTGAKPASKQASAEPAPGKQTGASKSANATDAKPATGVSNDEPPPAPIETPDRLKAGGLEPLVLAYLKENSASAPHGPTTVAKALGRSSGAVGNCLVRLTEAKKVKEVSDKPRRYSLAA